jgi:autotransporter translocation and assembly factor TamB
MRRLLLILAVTLIVSVIVAPLLAVWAVLYTERGAQYLVHHLPRTMAGVTLVIDGLSGTPARGLHVQRVEIDHELVHLKFVDVTARVQLAPLLLQSIHALHLAVGSAQIEVKRRTHPATPGPPSFLPRWMNIDVDDAQLGSAVLHVYNGFSLHASGLSAAAALRHTYMRFFQVNTVLEGAHLTLSGTLRATDPLGMEVRGHLDWLLAGQAPLTFNGSARGDLNALNVVAHVVSPALADVTGQAQHLTDAWRLVADVALRSLDLKTFGANTPFGSISGHIAGHLDEHGFEAHGPLNPTGLQAGVFDVALTGSYANQTLTAREVQLHHRDSGARVTASGSLAFVAHGPRIDLKGDWSDFRWPLAGREVAVRSPGGSFTFEGAMPYRIVARGRASAATLPTMPLDVDATLDKDSISFARAEIDAFGGHASLSGRVAWSPQQLWNVQGRLTNINPASFRANLPGSLTFMLEASGRGFDPQARSAPRSAI